MDPTGKKPRILIGIAGWSYSDWEGIVYPAKPGKDFKALPLLASWFDVCEINVSFYRIPSARMADGWANQIEAFPRFRFTAKLYQKFTHERKIDPSDVEAFKNFLKPLRESGRLEGLLLQFPWSFRPTRENWDHARRLFDLFGDVPLAMEIRHADWWKPRFFEVLRENRVSLANIDQPQLRNNIPPGEEVTGEIAYIRFHGRNEEYWWAEEEPYYGARYDYLYSQDELDPWIDRIKRMGQAAKSTVIVMNNHHRGDAVVNGLEIAALLNREKGEIPGRLFEAFPERLARAGLPVEKTKTIQGDLFQK